MMNYTITLNEYEIDQIRQALVRDSQWWAMQSHLDKDADDQGNKTTSPKGQKEDYYEKNERL